MALVPLLIRLIMLCMQAGFLTGNNVCKLFDYEKENKVSGLQLRGGSEAEQSETRSYNVFLGVFFRWMKRC